MGTYQDHTTTPYVHLAASVQRVAHNQLRCGITGTATASLHEIASSNGIRAVQAQLLDEILVAQVELNVRAKLVIGIECVGEPKICDDDIPVAIQ